MIGVLIVDDHQLVRVGLAALIEGSDELTVVGEAADGAEAVIAVDQLDPDVVLMDISMPVLDGIAATREITARHPGRPIVALTSFADHGRVRQMMAAGAVGYLLKDCEPQQLIAAIRAAAGGQVPLDPRVAAALLPRVAPAGNGLSAREVEVLRLTAKGLANKQIGRVLGISDRTVKVHLGNVFRRIGVGDRTSAALWAQEHLPPGDIGDGVGDSQVASRT